MNRAPLLIRGCGMATAVGLTAPVTCAAVRARIAGFQETRFMTADGRWIVGAEVPLEGPSRGVARRARLVAGPVRECLELEAAALEVPVLLGDAEQDRPGRTARLDEQLLPLLEEAIGRRLHPASRLLPMGRVAGAVAILEASKLVDRHGLRSVVVAGVDSYLAVATLRSLEERERLLTDRNSNGLVPGEAGSAVLVGPDDGRPGLAVRAVGFSTEEASVESGEPLLGLGLSAACRQALGTAGLGLHEIDYRIADASGEQYWLREAALATARMMRSRRESQEMWHPADCIGETGAAVVPILVGVAYWAMRKGYAPGPRALAQAANDDGRRGAVLLHAPRAA